MPATTYNTTKVLHPSGNLPLFKGPVHKLVAGKPKFIPKEGQMIIYDPFNKKGIEGIFPGDCPNDFTIAVACRNSRDEMTLKKMAGGHKGISSCSIKDNDASVPRCGQVAIVDFFIGCIECDTDYTITFTYKDQDSIARFGELRPLHSFTARVDCAIPCVDCGEKEASCDELVCELMKVINQEWDRTYGMDRITPDGIDIKDAKKGPNVLDRAPFTIMKLNPTDYKFCFDQLEGDCCVGCKIPPITEISIAGEVFELDCPDAIETYNIQEIIDAIDYALYDEETETHYGKAAYEQALTGCCPGKIWVNSCKPIDYIKVGDEKLTPEVCDVFENVKIKGCNTCKENRDDSWKPCCGIRLIARPLEQDCPCEGLPDKILYNKTRHLNIEGEGFKQWQCEVKQRSLPPINQGYEIQQLEYEAYKGGDFSEGFKDNYREGKYHRFGKHSRHMSTKIECEGQYCLWNFWYNTGTQETGLGTSELNVQKYLTRIVFNQADQVTKDSFFETMAPLFEKASCNKPLRTCDDADKKAEETGLLGASAVSETTFIGQTPKP